MPCVLFALVVFFANYRKSVYQMARDAGLLANNIFRLPHPPLVLSLLTPYPLFKGRYPLLNILLQDLNLISRYPPQKTDFT